MQAYQQAPPPFRDRMNTGMEPPGTVADSHLTPIAIGRNL